MAVAPPVRARSLPASRRSLQEALARKTPLPLHEALRRAGAWRVVRALREQLLDVSSLSLLLVSVASTAG